MVGDENQDGCAKVAKSMYTKSATCGVTSTLCYGVQWDAVLNFIDSNYYTGTCSEDSIVVNGQGKGAYGDEVQLTGSYESKHIYDLAGNVTEWTMTSFEVWGRLCRGSSRLKVDGAAYGAKYYEIPYDDWDGTAWTEEFVRL